MSKSIKQLSFLEANQEIAPEGQNRNSEQPETYTGMYAMHKYWSKKPYNLVSLYIEKYSKPNEIVLDPFCGSGVTITESVRLGRRAVGIDINPTAIVSTKMGLTHVDMIALKKAFEALRLEVENEINSLYQTDCPMCKNPKAIATHTIWKEGEIDEIWVECRACSNSKSIKKPSQIDKVAALEPIRSASWYPTNSLLENARINAKAGMRVCDLFTPRALSNLSLLLEKIRQIKDEQIKSVMEFCFSAMLPQASNMVFVIRRRGKANGIDGSNGGKAEVGSWVIGYWIPPEHFEIHIWRCFDNRFKRILKGKKEVNSAIPVSVREFLSFDELEKSQIGYLVSKGTATDLSIIPSDSINYIFTDPPHGNRIPYLELSLMWNSWLNHDFDLENEIIVSESKVRQKNVKDYEQRLKIAFGEMWRVLKSNGYVSIAFNSLDDDTWLSLLNTLLATGFEIKEITPLEYSARSVVQDNRQNALKTDFVITCQKQSQGPRKLIAFDYSKEQLLIALRDYLYNCKAGVETYEIINHLLIASIPMGTIFRVSQIVELVKEIARFDDGHWYLKEP